MINKNIKYIVNNRLCISCGACEYLSNGKIKFHEDKNNGMFFPNLDASLTTEEETVFKNICPGYGYPIIKLGNEIHNTTNKYDYRIGFYNDFFAVKSCSNEILKKSSSGGIMTELAIYMLKKGIVNGIISTKYVYADNNIIPKTFICKNENDIMSSQGSKYMPVPALSILNEIENFNGKLAYIGTPCQIATLKTLGKKYPEIQNKIIYTIGNFCGGYRDRREMYRLMEIGNMRKEKITYFQYRGDGQPGYMIIKSKNNEWKYKYPNYGKLTGYIKYYRCRTCIDATAELADVSCGDMWIDRFIKEGNWSAIIIRNKNILSIINQMVSENKIYKNNITFDELILSQRQNLASKKERYLSRNKFLKIIFKEVPTFDGGWNKNYKSNVLSEAKIYFVQKIKQILESLNLYSLIIKKK